LTQRAAIVGSRFGICGRIKVIRISGQPEGGYNASPVRIGEHILDRTMNKNISPAYANDYREWMQNGNFDGIYQRELPKMRAALKEEGNSLIYSPLSSCLDSIATYYFHRGTVALLEGDNEGWGDVQCGFWAAVYHLRYDIIPIVRWGRGRFVPWDTTEAVMLLGLAKLFGQEMEASFLKSEIAEHLPSFDEALGDKVASGRKIMDSIFKDTAYSFEELLKDRKECCQKRDAWPRRPTEITPFGVIDVEAMLKHPNEASFRYPIGMEFKPTPDGAVEDAIAAYHVWFG
jgi:hypothetical protein